MRTPFLARVHPRWVLAVALLGWNAVAWAQPSTLWLHSAIYDPLAQQMVVFGGTPDAQTFESDAWGLTLDIDPEWNLLVPQTGSPPGRLGHTAIYDPPRHRMLVFGGFGSGFEPLGDIWAFSLSDRTWSIIQPSGISPSARRYHSAIYDPLRDRMVVFGGESGSELNDLWSLWLSPSPRWERVFPNGQNSPLPRRWHSAIYDFRRDRMLVFGGDPSQSNDLWALSFSDTTWSLLSPSGTPPARRYGHSAVYDPVEDRMVVFGGSDGFQYLDDVWLLSLADPVPTWSPLTVTSPLPSPRYFHSAIYDSTHRRMIVFGGAPSVVEPTWGLSLASPMRWSPERPVMELSPAELVIPTVTVGDTVSVPFTLSNGGLNPLTIQSFKMPSVDAWVSSPNPQQLPWNTAISETLSLAATTPGLSQDSMVIVSNDPVAPRRQAILHIDVRGLEFDTHVLGNPDSVAPGVSFIVVVTPRPGVRIERGRVYYRIADGSSPFDSLSLTPLATDFIGAISASAVTERGVEYYVRVENSAFSAAQPATAPVTFLTQKVSSPQAITGVIPRPTSGSDFLVGQEIEVDVVLPDGAIFDSGALHFRRGGEQNYESAELSPTGTPGQTSATIPDSIVGARGVEYWVEVRTLRSHLRYPTNGSAPAILRTTIPDLAEPSIHAGGRYRLLTVPVDFGPDFSGSLDALLTDQLGTYAPTHWRAFTYDPSTNGNVEFSSAQSARFRPQPGRCFWLITRESHRVDTKPVAGFSTSTAGAYSIPLAQGWNLFGNPFNFPVAWAEVIRDQGVEDPIAFDPSRGTIGDYADASPSVLAPFEGYFVYSSQATTLQIPPREAPVLAANQPSIPGSAKLQDQEPGWQLRLVARTEGAVDGANFLGVRSGAAAGFDALDQREPPLPPGAWVSAAFQHPEWEDRSGEYRVDLRSPESDGETWEVEVRSSAHGEKITLDLGPMVSGAPEALCLVDREQGTSMEWLSSPETGEKGLRREVVSFGARPYRLAILAGSQAYVARAQSAAAVPRRVLLDQNAPNPFQLATRIRFALPRASRVSLQIFGVMGERVATMLEDARLEPGFHTVVWDGTRSEGPRVASGMYLIRLTVDGETLTRRTVVVR